MAQPPVVHAETLYLPPAPTRKGQEREDWSQVPGAELVYLWMAANLGRRTPVPTETIPGDPGTYARVDDNRWMADCHGCGTGLVVSTDDPRFGCTQCGRDWVPLIVPSPEEVATIDADLGAIEGRRFWWAEGDPRNPVQPEPPIPPRDPSWPDPSQEDME
ncbi:hypothetical protein ACWIFI_18660 [Streptomyces albidoflavus]